MGDYSARFSHPATIKEAIFDHSLIREQGFIWGKWVSSTETFPVYDPSTDNVIANIAEPWSRRL
jgi:succinate-semialdehyde dehydrogenase/glutarate-semialdehyde dehydrogenase